ncbi:hypothetical protein LDC_1991 [sediment metagenome]|uniref:Uncharacterized protein n=1 Tax=sediment metagenome TaxID=749907 RepID=D9PKC6_9ZZZZ
MRNFTTSHKNKLILAESKNNLTKEENFVFKKIVQFLKIRKIIRNIKSYLHHATSAQIDK